MIYLTSRENRHLFSKLICQMHQHRRQVFLEKLEWDLEAENGLEMDELDRDDTIYLLVVDDMTGRLRSSLRLNPTDQPTLLSEHFSGLCEAEVPCDRAIWEITRYCYNPALKSRDELIAALKETMCGVLECALLHGWEQLTLLIGRAILPYCLNCGWDIAPLGPSARNERDSIAAFKINATPAGLQAVRAYAGLEEPVLRIYSGAELAAA